MPPALVKLCCSRASGRVSRFPKSAVAPISGGGDPAKFSGVDNNLPGGAIAVGGKAHNENGATAPGAFTGKRSTLIPLLRWSCTIRHLSHFIQCGYRPNFLAGLSSCGRLFADQAAINCWKTEPWSQHAVWQSPAIQKRLDIGLRHPPLRKQPLIGGAALMRSEDHVGHPRPPFAAGGLGVEDV